MKARRGYDLLAQIGRRVEKKPALTIGADCKTRLAAWLDSLIAVPGERADGTAAIPLRKAAARRGTKNEDAQAARQS